MVHEQIILDLLSKLKSVEDARAKAVVGYDKEIAEYKAMISKLREIYGKEPRVKKKRLAVKRSGAIRSKIEDILKDGRAYNVPELFEMISKSTDIEGLKKKITDALFNLKVSGFLEDAGTIEGYKAYKKKPQS